MIWLSGVKLNLGSLFLWCSFMLLFLFLLMGMFGSGMLGMCSSSCFRVFFCLCSWGLSVLRFLFRFLFF